MLTDKELQLAHDVAHGICSEPHNVEYYSIYRTMRAARAARSAQENRENISAENWQKKLDEARKILSEYKDVRVRAAALVAFSTIDELIKKPP